MTISLIFTRVDVWEGLKYILYFASNAAFQIVEIASLPFTTSNTDFIGIKITRKEKSIG